MPRLSTLAEKYKAEAERLRRCNQRLLLAIEIVLDAAKREHPDSNGFLEVNLHEHDLTAIRGVVEDSRA
jgi:hypothetical protein